MLSQPSSNDTISSLSLLPSWLSMPSLPTSSSRPQALMLDMNLTGNNDNTPIATSTIPGPDISAQITEGREIEEGRRGRIRLKSLSRPKSYHQILEDFQNVQPGRHHVPQHVPPNLLIDSTIEENSESAASEGGGGRANGQNDSIDLTSTPVMNLQSQTPVPSPTRRREDTARRSKRFSLPAVALHTANVTTRATSVSSGLGNGSGGNGNNRTSGSGGVGIRNENETKSNQTGAMGRLRRLSLVPGMRN